MSTEHVFLVALEIEGNTRTEAETTLMAALPRPQGMGNNLASPVVCWWVAEDDRHDNSDNDSAVFVDPGAQAMAYEVLAGIGCTGPWNKPHREGGQFTGTYEPRPHSRYKQAVAVKSLMETIGIGQGDLDLLAALAWLVDNERLRESDIPAAFEALAGGGEYQWHGHEQDDWQRLTDETHNAVEEVGLLVDNPEED